MTSALILLSRAIEHIHADSGKASYMRDYREVIRLNTLAAMVAQAIYFYREEAEHDPQLQPKDPLCRSNQTQA